MRHLSAAHSHRSIIFQHRSAPIAAMISAFTFTGIPPGPSPGEPFRQISNVNDDHRLHAILQLTFDASGLSPVSTRRIPWSYPCTSSTNVRFPRPPLLGSCQLELLADVPRPRSSLPPPFFPGDGPRAPLNFFGFQIECCATINTFQLYIRKDAMKTASLIAHESNDREGELIPIALARTTIRRRSTLVFVCRIR